MSNNWQNLAIAEAQIQGAYPNIVLATIDAETSGNNIIADNGNALGYGQVWPKWHLNAFQYAADRFKLTLPDSLSARQQLVLSNDSFSMCVAVFVIKGVWAASHQDFRQFSLQYVGPAIPDSDYNRRYNIWLKYQGGNYPSSGFAGSSTHGNQNEMSIPETNYGIVANSQKFGNILYGRRYRVIVSNKNGSALDVSQLRCTFKIQKSILQPPNFAEIVLYNLSPDTENSIILEGNRVVVEAGYEGEQYGLIFDGDIIQPIRDKEDGVTFKLTLNSLDGDRLLNVGFVNFSIIKGQSSRAIIESVVSKVKVPTQIGSISEGLGKSELTRGKVVFGLAKDYLRQLAQTNNASFYVEDGKVNIVRGTDLPKGEIFDLAPESGLIGMPAQSDNGVSFKCLLNPRLKINDFVRIENRFIKAQTYQQGQNMRSLDSSGIYRIVGITYTGDTRGDNWYCECTTVSQAGIIPGMVSTVTGNPF